MRIYAIDGPLAGRIYNYPRKMPTLVISEPAIDGQLYPRYHDYLASPKPRFYHHDPACRWCLR